MPSLVLQSFNNNTAIGAVGSLNQTGTILNPLVHALGEPIANVTEEVRQTAQAGWHMGIHLSTLAAWWLIAYVGYAFVTDVFAPEVSMMQKGIRRAFKRARIY